MQHGSKGSALTREPQPGSLGLSRGWGTPVRKPRTYPRSLSQPFQAATLGLCRAAQTRMTWLQEGNPEWAVSALAWQPRVGSLDKIQAVAVRSLRHQLGGCRRESSASTRQLRKGFLAHNWGTPVGNPQPWLGIPQLRFLASARSSHPGSISLSQAPLPGSLDVSQATPNAQSALSGEPKQGSLGISWVTVDEKPWPHLGSSRRETSFILGKTKTGSLGLCRVAPDGKPQAYGSGRQASAS